MKVQLLLRLFCISKIAAHNEFFIAQVGADKAEYSPENLKSRREKRKNARHFGKLAVKIGNTHFHMFIHRQVEDLTTLFLRQKTERRHARCWEENMCILHPVRPFLRRICQCLSYFLVRPFRQGMQRESYHFLHSL